MHILQAITAKLTVKKVLSATDHLQIIVTHILGANPALLTLQDCFDEMRLNLRKLEHSVEAAAE